MINEINRTLMQLSRRAERNDFKILFETFVDSGPVGAVLTARDHINETKKTRFKQKQNAFCIGLSKKLSAEENPEPSYLNKERRQDTR